MSTFRRGLVVVALLVGACSSGSKATTKRTTTVPEAARTTATSRSHPSTTRATATTTVTTTVTTTGAATGAANSTAPSATPPPAPTTDSVPANGPAPSAAPAPGPAPSAAPAPGPTAPPGTPPVNGRPGAGLSAAGNFKVTLVRVIDPAQPAGGTASAGPGGRLLAAQLDIQNLSSAATTVPVAAAITVVNDEDQSFQAHPGPIAGCAELGAAPVLPAHATASGCVGFEVPAESAITKVTFTPPDGSDPLSWRLR